MASPISPIVLIDGIEYHLVTPESEAWLENAIQSNCKHLFGSDSFYFNIKKLIRSKAGITSIPDGYVIFFDQEARWAVVEVELASHPVYDHLIPQLTKFNRGIEDDATKRQLVDVFYRIFDEDEVLRAKLKRKIRTGEIYKFISDLLFSAPVILVVIDQKTEGLKEALKDIRGNVHVIEFQTFRREAISDDVNAFVFEPMFRQLPIRWPNLVDSKRQVNDKYGCRLGSNRAKINAVLSREPKSMKTLVEEAGLSGSYYVHLKQLIKKGYVTKTDKGFKISVDGRQMSAAPVDAKISEFWEPIRREGLFKGKPVPIRDEGWIGKGIKGFYLLLVLHNHKCEVKLWFRSDDRLDRRKRVIALFQNTQYKYRLHESPKAAQVIFPVLDKGKKNRKDWPEIRQKLVTLGTRVYNTIKESNL